MADMTLDLTRGGMVALTRDSLAALRDALMRDTGGAAAGYLQEAGYAGGASLHAAFSAWLAARGAEAPEALAMDDFQRHAAAFFREAGWGALDVVELHDGVVALDSADWGEATPGGGLPYPGCHLSAGMLADFFGRVAGSPLAVMETECRSAGSARCRFLLGSPETLQAVYEGMAAGTDYESAVAATA